jgi:phage terminase large subunit-like protein
MLYVMCCEHEPGPQLYSAATTGKQARIVWDVAKKMVQRLPGLRRTFQLEAFANAIVRYESGGNFAPINSKASTQDGLNPSAISLDELHAHKTHDLKNVLASAAGARANKLFLYTTTEGYETPGPWPEERSFAQQILLGTFEADHYLAVMFTVDDEDEPFDERRWIKANPLIDVNKTLLAAIRVDALEAKRKPGTFAEFRIKRLNRRAETAAAWINLHRFRQCEAEFDVPTLIAAGAQCWGALDLASTLDMCAWARLWALNGQLFAKVRYWVPSEAVRERTERNSVPYQGWVRGGFIAQTDGNSTDYDVIEQQIRADVLECSPRIVAVDPWNAQQISNNLLADGVPIQKFIQGPRSYTPAMRAFEGAYMDRRLKHDGNPVLIWNAANIVPRHDANMNIAPDRKRSADRIDGAVALIMAVGAMVSEESVDLSGFLSNPIVA